MRVSIRHVRNGQVPEYYEGTISNDEGVVHYQTTRWSEEGTRSALLQYIYTELKGKPPTEADLLGGRKGEKEVPHV